MTDAKSEVLAKYPKASVSTWRKKYQIVRPRVEGDKTALLHVPISGFCGTEKEAWLSAAIRLNTES